MKLPSAIVRTHITMAVPPEPGPARGSEACTPVRGPPAAMRAPGDKRSAAQNSEPDPARIPLLEQRASRVPRWNPPVGESALQVSAGRSQGWAKGGARGAERLCAPLLSGSPTPVLTPPPQVLLFPPWDRVTQGNKVGLHILCPLLKCHKEVAGKS